MPLCGCALSTHWAISGHIDNLRPWSEHVKCTATSQGCYSHSSIAFGVCGPKICTACEHKECSRADGCGRRGRKRAGSAAGGSRGGCSACSLPARRRQTGRLWTLTPSCSTRRRWRLPQLPQGMEARPQGSVTDNVDRMAGGKKIAVKLTEPVPPALIRHESGVQLNVQAPKISEGTSEVLLRLNAPPCRDQGLGRR